MPPNTEKRPEYDTESTLEAVATKLRAVLDGFELYGDGEHPAVLSDLARIATALTTTCAEIRQAQKAKVREVSKIPMETIVSYLKTLPADARQGIAAEITGADAGESLL